MKGFFASVMVVIIFGMIILSLMLVEKPVRTIIEPHSISALFPSIFTVSAQSKSTLEIHETFSSSLDEYGILKQEGIDVSPLLFIGDCATYSYPDFRKDTVTITKKGNCTLIASFSNFNNPNNLNYTEEINGTAVYSKDNGHFTLSASYPPGTASGGKMPDLFTEIRFNSIKLHFQLLQ